MKTLTPLRGWLALVVALVLWAIAIYIVQSIEQQKNNYAVLVSEIEKEAQLMAQATRLHGLMNDTKNPRTALKGFVSADVIGLVDAVDAVGKTIGVDLRISNVQPEAQKKGAQPGAPIPVNFVVQASGSFAQMARLVELLNTLPIPGTIQQLEFTHPGQNWNLTARIRVLTASEISS